MNSNKNRMMHTQDDDKPKTNKSTKGKVATGRGKKVDLKDDRELYERLLNARVVQKELVYIIGLSPRIASKTLLLKPEYLGQYGTITKIVVNTSKAYNPKNTVGPCYSAYVTYNSYRDASIAILAIDQFTYDDRLIRASFGTTKYCTHFLDGRACTNSECLYLHEMCDESDVLAKDEISSKKTIFLEQQKTAVSDIGLYDLPLEDFLKSMSKFKPKAAPQFPAPEVIYQKKFSFLSGNLVSMQKAQIKKGSGVISKQGQKAAKDQEVTTSQKEANKKGGVSEEDKTVEGGRSAARRTIQTEEEKESGTQKRSKLGVCLMEKSPKKQNEESDDSIIIPGEFQAIVDSCFELGSQDSGITLTRHDDSLIIQIETASLSKKEAEWMKAASSRWIDDILKSDSEEDKKSTPADNPPAPQLFVFPLKYSDIVRVKTPIKDRYYQEDKSGSKAYLADYIHSPGNAYKKTLTSLKGRNSRAIEENKSKLSTSSSSHSMAPGNSEKEEGTAKPVDLRDVKDENSGIGSTPNGKKKQKKNPEESDLFSSPYYMNGGRKEVLDVKTDLVGAALSGNTEAKKGGDSNANSKGGQKAKKKKKAPKKGQA